MSVGSAQRHVCDCPMLTGRALGCTSQFVVWSASRLVCRRFSAAFCMALPLSAFALAVYQQGAAGRFLVLWRLRWAMRCPDSCRGHVRHLSLSCLMLVSLSPALICTFSGMLQVVECPAAPPPPVISVAGHSLPCDSPPPPSEFCPRLHVWCDLALYASTLHSESGSRGCFCGVVHPYSASPCMSFFPLMAPVLCCVVLSCPLSYPVHTYVPRPRIVLPGSLSPRTMESFPPCSALLQHCCAAMCV